MVCLTVQDGCIVTTALKAKLRHCLSCSGLECCGGEVVRVMALHGHMVIITFEGDSDCMAT